MTMGLGLGSWSTMHWKALLFTYCSFPWLVSDTQWLSDTALLSYLEEGPTCLHSQSLTGKVRIIYVKGSILYLFKNHCYAGSEMSFLRNQEVFPRSHSLISIK